MNLQEANFLIVLNRLFKEVQQELRELYIKSLDLGCLSLTEQEAIDNAKLVLAEFRPYGFLRHIGRECRLVDHEGRHGRYYEIEKYTAIPQRLDLVLFSPTLAPFHDVTRKAGAERIEFNWVIEETGHHAQSYVLSIALKDLPQYIKNNAAAPALNQLAELVEKNREAFDKPLNQRPHSIC